MYNTVGDRKMKILSSIYTSRENIYQHLISITAMTFASLQSIAGLRF